MNAIQQDTEPKKYLYLQRVNQLYTEIRNWLQDEPLILEDGEIQLVEAMGQYQVPYLSIKTENGKILAELKPTTTATLLSEGKINVDGQVDGGYILYMRENNPQTFFEIDGDNWYWFEERLDVKPSPLKEKKSLLKMITWVSDYEF